jgi:hypothetical protein
LPEISGEYIDRLVNVEMRFGTGLPRGVTHQMYDAARKLQGAPLTYLAAKRLVEKVKPGDYVLIATGAGTEPGLPWGETDGPLGAAALARAVGLGLGAKPVVVTEKRCLEPIRAAFNATGFTLMPDDWVAGRKTYSAAFRTFPGGEADDTLAAEEVVNTFRPSAMIFVEKAGPNAQGVYHSILGIGRSKDQMANAYVLVDLAKATGALTIGIGDGGNEIGCGKIYEDIRRIQPYGTACQCPCGDGVATVVATDVLVMAAVSNWGAYGVAAELALLKGNMNILHDEATEARMLEACVAAGGFDGGWGAGIPCVDGTNARVQTSIITMLRQIVENAMVTMKRDF